MYNGIGLTTPRGSGTNGHVQRNWAFVRPGKKDNSNYRSEDDIEKLDASLNRPPNKEILDHDRKRKIEVKCIEFEEILEKQGRTPKEIQTKVESYRQKLMGLGKNELPKDEFGRITVRETHQVAEAQQEKNARLRDAFNISEYFVEGSSFDSDRKSKEDLAKSLALQKELDAQRESAAAAAAAVGKEKESKRRYALVRTPSKERDGGDGSGGGNDGGVAIKDTSGDEREHISKSDKKKKKKRTRESSASPERKKDKKKKSKKHKKESKSKKKKSRKRKAVDSDDSADSDKDSDNEGENSDSESERDVLKKQRKKSKKDKKKRDKKKKKERLPSMDKSPSNSLRTTEQHPKHKQDKQTHVERSSSKAHSVTNTFGHRSRERVSANRTARRRRSSDDSYTRDRNQKDRGRDVARRSKSVERRKRSISRSNERKRKVSVERNRKVSVERNRKVSVERKRRRNEDSPRPERKRNNTHSRSRERNGAFKNSAAARSSRCDRSRSSSAKNRNRSTTPARHQKREFSPQRSPKRKQSPSSVAAAVVTKQVPFNPFKAAEVVAAAVQPVKPVANPFKTSTESVKEVVPVFHQQIRQIRKNRSISRSSDSDSDRSRSKRKICSARSPPLERKNYSRAKRERSNSAMRRNRKELSRSRSARSRSNRRDRRQRSRSLSKSRSRRRRSRSLQSGYRKPTRSPAVGSSRRTPLRRRSIESGRRTPSRKLSHDSRRRSPLAKRARDSRNSRSRQKSPDKKASDLSETRKPMANVDLKPRHARSPTPKKVIQKSPPPPNETQLNEATPKVIEKPTERAQSSRSSHNSSDLSYSPAQRNPERYRDIIEKVEKAKQDKRKENLIDGKNEKSKEIESDKERLQQKSKPKVESDATGRTKRDNKDDKHERTHKKDARRDDSNSNKRSKQGPVVRLQSQSDDESNEERTGKVPALDEFQESRRERDLNELKMLEQLKSGIAAKAKEKIEKMAAISSSTDGKEVSDNDYQRRGIRNSLNEFLAANNVAAVGMSINSTNKSLPTAAIYPQPLNVLTENETKMKIDLIEEQPDTTTKSNTKQKDTQPQTNCKALKVAANGDADISPTINTQKDQKTLPFNNVRSQHKVKTNNTSDSGGGSAFSYSPFTANNALPYATNPPPNLPLLRPSRINNSPLITATQFHNQLLNKHLINNNNNSIFIDRRDFHRYNMSLSANVANSVNSVTSVTPTNFSSNNLLLPNNHLNHHHHHHLNHHNSPAANIADQLLIAASLAAVGRHGHSHHHHHHSGLGAHHGYGSAAAAAAAAATSLSYHHLQKPKIVIKPFKINDPQPLVAALADSTLVDAIVSKVSTATVAAAENAARRRSSSRTRHSRSRARAEVTSRRSASRSHSSHSSTSSSRSRSVSQRSTRSHSKTQSSRSSCSSRSSSSSSSGSTGSSRTGSRSPSIPRRRGSPSFLDRRRITSARKRPIPYHRKSLSDASSCCSSCLSSPRTPSISPPQPLRHSLSPMPAVF